MTVDTSGPEEQAAVSRLVESATTWLFVPGSRPDRYARALGSGADVVIVDLEDAVAPGDKGRARESAAGLLASNPAVAVRVNGAGTPWHAGDLALVARYSCAVVLPKAESPDAVGDVVRASRSKVVLPLVESARGVVHATQLAAVEGVRRLILGNADLAQQLGVAPDDRQALLMSRSQLVAASAYADLVAPVDGVTLELTDSSVCAGDARHGREMGFGGKLCIHPAQVAAVRDAYRPTEAELTWARNVMASAEAGAARVGDTMVDRPVVLRAEWLLRQERSL
ncbi:citryl-CoA lyase [Acrocarpospora pleiomorpha]|uniref:Citryl-CoA lyase n=1 Tax=Acrocarpospora pleiomorpha TaxID=90975 RepID=A0A5M3XCX9_9ACTN|nr:CoA ester lyase [Acrocarpospora pleiomorpha]GES19477.1 citryl-CoA lyase [Acrocarpospora pleiomorpha]